MTKEVTRCYENDLWNFLECEYDEAYDFRLKYLYNPEEELRAPTHVTCTAEQWDKLHDILRSYLCDGKSAKDWNAFVGMYDDLVTNDTFEQIKDEYDQYLYHENKEQFIKNITEIIN